MGLEVVFDDYLVAKKPCHPRLQSYVFYVVAIIYIFFTGVNSCFEQKLEISF